MPSENLAGELGRIATYKIVENWLYVDVVRQALAAWIQFDELANSPSV